MTLHILAVANTVLPSPCTDECTRMLVVQLLLGWSILKFALVLSLSHCSAIRTLLAAVQEVFMPWSCPWVLREIVQSYET
jgi:hypothetical protein